MFDPISIAVEIAVIMKGAQAAVTGVQSAIKLGKDIHSVSKELYGFFHKSAELKIIQAEVQAKSIDPECTEDLTALAFDIVLSEKKLRDDEQQLKNMIIYELDEAEVWFDMVRKRDELIEQRAHAAKEKIREANLRVKAESARLQRKKENFWNLVNLWATVAVGTSFVFATFYGLWYMIINYGNR